MKFKLNKILIFCIALFSFFNFEKSLCKHADTTQAYINHCWDCGATINSDYCRKCRSCGWYVCVSCGACDPQCSSISERYDNYDGNSSSSKKSSDDSDFIIWALLIGVGIPLGIYLYDKNKNQK